MGDRYLRGPSPSPWLISFGGRPVARHLRMPSVQDQIEHDKQELGLKSVENGSAAENLPMVSVQDQIGCGKRALGLKSFKGGPVAEDPFMLSVQGQTECDNKELGFEEEVREMRAANTTPVSCNLSGIVSYHSYNNNNTPSTPATPKTPTASHLSFYALAARAYQESIRPPDSPPPSVWAPGDQLHLYYTQLLIVFFDNFRTLLHEHQQLQAQQGNIVMMNKNAFCNEWLRHSRSVMDNIRAEWGQHPLSSGLSVKTTSSNTMYRDVANMALQHTTLQPTAPPQEGWRRGQPLHPYYVLMLGRFENQLRSLLEEEFGSSMALDENALQAEIFEYEALILQEYRKMWIEIFGL
ncbi:hypothetical protein PABG_01399 [Paracoccidioides brasiliensis Pb03]|nr:hypothetical protein PABG_01399 [Paracoccidioides brasiliensis Pb03]